LSFSLIAVPSFNGRRSFPLVARIHYS